MSKDHQKALRALGFKRTQSDKDGNLYEKDIPDSHPKLKHTGGIRTLSVEISKDPKFLKHRVTHNFMGHQGTTPTEFNSIADMHKAIKHESSRTDHPKLNRKDGYVYKPHKTLVEEYKNRLSGSQHDETVEANDQVSYLEHLKQGGKPHEYKG